MRIGIVLTIKNEAVLLPRNIEIHRLLGIDHFFLYVDDNSQGYGDTCDPGRGDITIRSSIGRADLPASELARESIEKLLELSEEHHTARQMLNAHHAMLQAREAGIDWMLSIDADEVVYPFEHLGPGQKLHKFFQGYEAAHTVRFLPIEVCPRENDTRDPVVDLPMFLNIFSKEGDVFKSNVAFKRGVLDPYGNTVTDLSGYIGHRIGKVAVRPQFDIEPNTVHNFRFREVSEPVQEEVVGLLHYNHYSFEDFLKKYQNFRERPDHYVYGAQVEYVPKLLWRDMVNDGQFSRDELRTYFTRYIAFSDEEIVRLKSLVPSPLVEISAPGRMVMESRRGK